MTRSLPFFLAGLAGLGVTGPAAAQLSGWTDRTSLSGVIGTLTVDRRQWQRLAVRPASHIGDLEAAFDVELFIDEEGRIRDRGWDFSSRRAGVDSFMRKIHHIQYGYPESLKGPVYARVGALESITLDQGGVMRRYRNTFGYPGIKRTGVDLRIRGFVWEGLTVRGVVSDLADLLDRAAPVLGGRASARPWGPLEMGGTVVVDIDQLGALPDSLRAGRPRDPFGVYAADARFPLYEGTGISLSAYGGVARSLFTPGPGTGVFGPGLSLVAGRLTARAEGRFTRGRFEPDHFDGLYDQTRAVADPATGAVTTREDALLNTSLRGVFADVEFDGGRFLHAIVSYQHLAGNGQEDRLLLAVLSIRPGILGAIPKISVSEGFFEKRARGGSTADFLRADPSTRFGYRVGLRPSGSVSVIWEMEFTYAPDGRGGFERQRTLNLETQFGL